MTTQEKRLSIFAAAIFLGYLVPFQLFPFIGGYVSQEWEHYQTLKTEIPRYQRLREQSQVWQDKHAAAQAQLQQVQSGILQAPSREQAAARLQSTLKLHAQDAGIQIKSLDVPEFAASGEWLLVTQSIQFVSNSSNTFTFLKALSADPLLLEVVELDFHTFRANQLNGKVKVTAFIAKPTSEAG